MPIYEYRCGNCNHELETLQKVSDPPLTVCPACNEETLKKKVSAAGFRLKGGGWYETDFKSDKRRNIAGDAANDAAKPGKSEKGESPAAGTGASSDKSSSKVASASTE